MATMREIFGDHCLRVGVFYGLLLKSLLDIPMFMCQMPLTISLLDQWVIKLRQDDSSVLSYLQMQSYNQSPIQIKLLWQNFGIVLFYLSGFYPKKIEFFF